MITKQALDYYQRVFGMPYPFDEYHQAFVPDFNAGAMENPGCVTLRDQLLFRGRATQRRAGQARRRDRARDGPHVVRRSGDDALVERPLAQRVVRRVPGSAVLQRGDGVPGRGPSSASSGRTGARSPINRRPPTRWRPTARGMPSRPCRTSTASPTPRAQRCSSSCTRTSVTRLSSPACAATSSDFAYGNATFADLIAHWSASVGESQDRDHRPIDLQAWAQSWLRTAGMDTLDVLESPPQIMINQAALAGRGHPSAPHRRRQR